MKEYQIKSEKPYVLPEPVYRQALWAVKDLARMKERLHTLEEMVDALPQMGMMERRGGSSVVSDRTGLKAGEMANLSMRIEAIERALRGIPEEYRQGILHKLAYGIPYGDEYHLNTWKKWQQVYLYQVAVELQLI